MSESRSNLIQRAKAAHVAKNLNVAENLYNQALSDIPGQVEVRLLLGILYAQSDRELLAAGTLAEVLEEDPNNFVALSWLCGILSSVNRFPDAKAAGKRALRLNPTDLTTLLHYATACFGNEDFEEATKTFLHVIRNHPRNLSAYYGLSTSFLRLGDPQQARLVLLDAVKLSPDLETLEKIGEVCLACERPEETVEITQRMLSKDPNHLGALLLQARAHRLLQDEQNEDKTLSLALKLSPDNALAHALRGRRLQSLGLFADAEDEFKISIELDPTQGVAYHGVTSGRKIDRSDIEFVESMEAAVRAQGMSDDDLAHLHFALGKAYDNLGEYGTAIPHFDEGNRLMRRLRMGNRKFDRDAMKLQIAQICKTFTKELLVKETKSESYPLQPVSPIIVAGIMRSGTTLVEQILSRHSMIGAGGEQSFWRRVEPECVDYELQKIHRSPLERARRDYNELLVEIAPGYCFVIDKNPANRMVYGLIHLAFPDAHIVHMQRNPVDVALSIYTTLIRTGAPFIGDKSDIVFALQMHKKLVTHWLDVLPPKNFRIVQYERLVENRQEVTRDTINFLGLPWEEACLSPEENKRTILTPSLWQARQPVYSHSIDRWRRYEPWLGPFEALLDQRE